jgi:hypothetical protein
VHFGVAHADIAASARQIKPDRRTVDLPIDKTLYQCFRSLRRSRIISVVPKRLWTTTALLLIVIVSLIMIFSGSLGGAAAWANIIALPVAIVGVILTLRGPNEAQPGLSAQDRNAPGRSVSPDSGTSGLTQIGFAQHYQINVGRDYYGPNPDSR